MEYLNYLGTSGNKLNSITKEMKSNFFSKMSDSNLNKHDELKFLILMREELFKYKTKLYYFNRMKNRALYDRDIIDEENPFINFDYKLFKKLNSNIVNIDSNNIDFFNNNLNDINKNKNLNINNIDDFNINDLNNNNISDNFKLLDLNEDEKFGNNRYNNNGNKSHQPISELDKLLNNKDMLKENSSDKQNYYNKNSKENENNNIIDFNDLLVRNSSIGINNKDIQNKDNKEEINNYNELLFGSKTYNSKNSINNIQDSLNVLDVQKNINDALTNTNEIFNKINSQQSGSINNSYNKKSENKYNTYNSKNSKLNLQKNKEKKIEDDVENFNVVNKNSDLDQYINNYNINKNFDNKRNSNQNSYSNISNN